MTNPFYSLQINVTIKGAKVEDDIVMQFSRGVQFAPVPGLKLALWREDEDNEEDEYVVELEDLTYSFKESAFVCSIEDAELADAIYCGENPIEYGTQIVAWYESYGFTRLNHKTAKAIKGEGNESY